MAWRVEYSKEAEREIAKLDKPIAQRIIRFMGNRVAKLENPRSIGQALAGSTLGNYWKYRIGDYRIIADIQDRKLIVLVVRGKPARSISMKGCASSGTPRSENPELGHPAELHLGL